MRQSSNATPCVRKLARGFTVRLRCARVIEQQDCTAPPGVPPETPSYETRKQVKRCSHRGCKRVAGLGVDVCPGHRRRKAITAKRPKVAPPAPLEVDADQWRADPEGYARWRGLGKRGPRSRAGTDEQDLIDAINSLVCGRTGLALAHTDAVKELGRLRHRAAIDAALGQLELAARFIAEVVQRNRSSGRL